MSDCDCLPHSEQSGKTDRKKMPRREFLSTGTAALGGAVVAGPASATEPLRRPSIRVRQDANPCEGNSATDFWTIPARQLSTLWGGLWQRVAARVWDQQSAWPPASTDQDIGDYIRTWIEEWFGGSVPAEPILPSGSPQPAISMSLNFQQDLIDLYEFLGQPVAVPEPPPDPGGSLPPQPFQSVGRAPIHFLGVGGYDFVLSEKGLDLIAPPDIGDMNPPGLLALLAHYEYRETGRPAIAMAGVLETAPGDAHVALAPTSASQIRDLDPSLIVAMNPCEAGSPAQILSYCGTAEIARAHFDRVFQEPGPNFDSANVRSVLVHHLGMDPEDADEIVEMLESGDFAGAHAEIDDFIEENSEGVDALNCRRPPPLTNYACLIALDRCWVLEGATYRGMLEQFPRIVAAEWSVGNNVRASLSMGLLRENIEKRLETSTPGGMRLEFQQAGSPSGSVPWDPADLMITNRGLFFPFEIGRPNNPGARPNLPGMLDGIIHGRAGNPVFTDSSPSK